MRYFDLGQNIFVWIIVTKTCQNIFVSFLFHPSHNFMFLWFKTCGVLRLICTYYLLPADLPSQYLLYICSVVTGHIPCIAFFLYFAIHSIFVLLFSSFQMASLLHTLPSLFPWQGLGLLPSRLSLDLECMLIVKHGCTMEPSMMILIYWLWM
jgi:hypothetical protein